MKKSDLLIIAIIATALTLFAKTPMTMFADSPISPVSPIRPTPTLVVIEPKCVGESDISARHDHDDYHMRRYYLAPGVPSSIDICAEMLPTGTVYHEERRIVNLWFSGGARWLVHRWFDTEHLSLYTPTPLPPVAPITPVPTIVDEWPLDEWPLDELWYQSDGTACVMFTDGERVTRIECP